MIGNKSLVLFCWPVVPINNIRSYNNIKLLWYNPFRTLINNEVSQES